MSQACTSSGKFPLKQQGKVRDIYDIGYSILAMVHSDRLSSFDRHVCNIPGKGMLLTQMSDYWFKRTNHIIPNHCLYSRGNLMLVKKCQVIPVEVVVRGYITGSTSTSLWTHYQRGERVYCGVKFPEGLVKNQKLERPVITPTTKSDTHDEPISGQEVVERGFVSLEEWNYICDKALELFNFASNVAAKAGYILADTKLEFGRDPSNGNIILIDEAFTCDSSRYWDWSSYQKNFKIGLEPMKNDKDLIREYLKQQCITLGSDPYQAQILPKIPLTLVEDVRKAYLDFYRKLTGNWLSDHSICNVPYWEENVDRYLFEKHSPAVIILSGANQMKSDAFASLLNERGIYSFRETCSSYLDLNSNDLMCFIKRYNIQSRAGRRLIICCTSVDDCLLGNLVAHNLSDIPVVSLQKLPLEIEGAPIATFSNSLNAAAFIQRILALSGL